MADTPKDKVASSYSLPHVRVERFITSGDFSPPRRDQSGRSSGKTPAEHGRRLQEQLAIAFDKTRQRAAARDSAIAVGSPGVYLEVSSETGIPNDLGWSRQGIRLGAIQVSESGGERGALFVPDQAQEFLTAKVREYGEEVTPAGKPKNQAKIEPLDGISAGSLASLWTDRRPLPDQGQSIWWECWCWEDRIGNHNLQRLASQLNLRISDSRLEFPEFILVPIYGTANQIYRLIQNCDVISEIRQASDSPVFFMTNARREQDLYVDDLLGRVSPPGADAPAICILDTGVNRAHPLITPALAVEDCQAVNSRWGVGDHEGHGTNMAGNALYGDLTYPLADQSHHELPCCLESVKFLAPPGFPNSDPDNYGAITQAAVSLPEIEKPERPRLFCMAVTNEELSGERPTSWSAALDQICVGAMPGDADANSAERLRRLFIVSAGNIRDPEAMDGHTDPNEFPIEDPAQAWNALSIGGYTDKVDIEEPDLRGWLPAAAVGERSPYSRISTDWPHALTAIKPEIVFEAGNRAINSSRTELIAGVDSLSLLTTDRNFVSQPLTTFWATSAATALAARYAGSIMAQNPDLWPETVRALMVHSAVWSPSMHRQLLRQTSKRARVGLARQFGYGVPNLDRALASAQSDVALVAQAEIQPFKRERDQNGRLSSAVTFAEIHYYNLPWPKQALQQLDGDVKLKVALSYFIEPSPGESAPTNPYRYQSFGLRFALKRSDETDTDFLRRINRLERDEGETMSPSATDQNWLFGAKSIAAGSLHCDVWEGPAVQLAAMDRIAIYPISGWWRYRIRHQRYNDRTRYALVVSITSVNATIDLYTEILNEVKAKTEILT